MHKDLIEPTLKFLGKYIVFSKAEMKNQSHQLFCYGLNEQALTANKVDLPQASSQLTELENGQLIRTGEQRLELWSNTELEATGSLQDWLIAELESGIVWVAPQTSEEYIPQMYNLHNIEGISFEKGCYLGQEIVARMQYRGELKKRLHIAELSADHQNEASEVGAKVVNDSGKNLGNVVARSANSVALVIKAEEAFYQLEDGTALRPKEIAES
jgi:folate-binding protein YgfZ